MSVFAFARRGACVSVSILALGVSPAFAQQAPIETNPVAQQAAPAAGPAEGTDSVTSAGGSSPQATPTPAGTSELPELVVNDDGKKKKKKAAKTQQQPAAASTSSNADPEAAEKPPAVTLGTAAPADTGTTTFDANAVQMRTNGSGDANTFIRNLPNVQYQTQSSQNAGVTSTKLVDTKPELMSISGGRTYENNFIINGVSTTNITGVAGGQLSASGYPGTTSLVGLSPQTQYVPADFVGQATIIDSNASAEYGQFVGGVVVYDLQGPPTDRYRASVNFSRDSSDYADFLLATKDGTNQQNKVAPTYEKTNLSASVGAPITPDFAFIAQASRREAESTKPTGISVAVPQVGESSDNVFLRFAATARTDVGKFTFDVSRTDYFQHWVEETSSPNSFYDTQTQTTSAQLKYETDLAGIRSDDVGLGRVKLKATAYHNNTATTNESSAASGIFYVLEGFTNYVPGQGWTNRVFSIQDAPDWCKHWDPATLPQNAGRLICSDRDFGNSIQSQEDFGVQANLTGDLLLGTFKLGGELKQYEGRRARLSDWKSASAGFALNDATNTVYNTTSGAASGGAGNSTFTKFTCSDAYCGDDWLASSYTVSKAYELSKTLDAVHAYTEIDQTLAWFNVRAGARLDYDDYFENLNLAPRLSGTVKPVDGLSFTAGYNRYYLGETLYYALRDGISGTTTATRKLVNGLYWNPATGVANDFNPETTPTANLYKFSQLDTPFNDEYTGAVGIKDPLLGGQLRLRYLQRYGRDEFSTTSDPATCSTCYKVGNEGESTYRSASAEYGKSWDKLRNPFFLNAAAISGSVTWSKQSKSQDSYLVLADIDGNGSSDSDWNVYYKKNVYAPGAFSAVTGNLDIPVRFGATLATVWFDDLLELNLNAGINLGYEGVYASGTIFDPTIVGCTPACSQFDPWSYKAALKLDLSGRVNVNEYAAIDFHVDNITNSTQSYVATYQNPWVIGRSFWIGSTLKLQ